MLAFFLKIIFPQRLRKNWKWHTFALAFERKGVPASVAQPVRAADC
jgi:hypothetical protein